MHHIATKIAQEGFKPRVGDTGHDVPVLVRESEESLQGAEALRNWHKVREQTAGFPRIRTRNSFFCSLGNGHFSQALNCFRCGVESIFTNTPYRIGNDAALMKAVMKGIPSVILSPDIPWGERKWVSEMLNATHDLSWQVSAQRGVVVTMREKAGQGHDHFVNLSKMLDAAELSGLVKIKQQRDAAKKAGAKSRL